MKRIVSLLLCLLMLLTILPAYASADKAGDAAFWKQYFENFMTYVLFEKLGLEPDETHCREVDRDSLLRTFLRTTGSCEHEYAAPSWDWESEEDLVYATFTCEKCGESVVLNTPPVFIETIPASGTEPAKNKYIATIEFMGETYESVYFRIVESHNHEYGDPSWSKDTSENLIAIFTCNLCLHQETVIADIKGSTNYPATCTTPRTVIYRLSAKFQGKTYVNNEYVDVVSPALGHKFGAWSQSAAPSCTEPGEEARSCTRSGCTETETRPIAALGHQFGEWSHVDPTCTEQGKETRTCGRCSETEIIWIDALGHDFNEWTQTAAPTCTETGEEARSCSRCSETETREKEALGHDYQPVVTPPTCTENGYTTYTCSRCSDSYTDNEVPATGHDWGEPIWNWESQEDLVFAQFLCETCGDFHFEMAAPVTERCEPSCTVDGYEQKSAAVEFNGNTYTDAKDRIVLPAFGHTSGEPVRENEHAPGCTDPGSYDEVVYCTVCNEELSRETLTVEATGHKPGDAVRENEKAPTCSEAGSYDEVVYCTACGEELNRETKEGAPATGEHVWGEPRWNWESQEDLVFAQFQCTVCGDFSFVMAPPEADHMEPSCTEAGYDGKKATVEFHGVRYTDSKVLTVLEALGHDYSSSVTKPTCTATGYTTYTCSRCGDQYTANKVAALGHKWDKGKVTKEPTTTSEGVKTYTCTRCKKTKTEPIPMLQPTASFVDVKDPNAYYYDAVYWAVAHKPYQITAGLDKTHFGPDKTVTRAQAMVFFWAAKDRPAFKKANTQFVDVKKGDWYYKAIMWAVENGITAGTDPTHFSPNKTCNRGEILAFLYAAMKKPKVKISNPYKDISNQWYKKAALWAYEKRIEKGENGKFNASTPCTRASVVTYLYRFLERKGLVE